MRSSELTWYPLFARRKTCIHLVTNIATESWAISTKRDLHYINERWRFNTANIWELYEPNNTFISNLLFMQHGLVKSGEIHDFAERWLHMGALTGLRYNWTGISAIGERMTHRLPLCSFGCIAMVFSETNSHYRHVFLLFSVKLIRMDRHR